MSISSFQGILTKFWIIFTRCVFFCIFKLYKSPYFSTLQQATSSKYPQPSKEDLQNVQVQIRNEFDQKFEAYAVNSLDRDGLRELLVDIENKVLSVVEGSFRGTFVSENRKAEEGYEKLNGPISAGAIASKLKWVLSILIRTCGDNDEFLCKVFQNEKIVFINSPDR